MVDVNHLKQIKMREFSTYKLIMEKFTILNYVFINKKGASFQFLPFFICFTFTKMNQKTSF